MVLPLDKMFLLKFLIIIILFKRNKTSFKEFLEFKKESLKISLDTNSFRSLLNVSINSKAQGQVYDKIIIRFGGDESHSKGSLEKTKIKQP